MHTSDFPILHLRQHTLTPEQIPEGYCDLIRFDSGCGTLFWGERVRSFMPGTVMLLPATPLWHLVQEDDAPMTGVHLRVRVNWFSTLCSTAEKAPALPTTQPMVFCPSTQTQALLDALFSECEDLRCSEIPFLSLQLGCRLLQILTLLAEAGTRDSENTPVDRALLYLNQAELDHIGIDQVAEATGVSKFHLCRQFRRITGITIMDYVTELRIRTAKNLLRQTVFPIGEIAEACGFSDASAFCHAFKKTAGISPRAYRNVPAANA